MAAARGIKATEKVAVGAIRTALQTWLAPQLTDISQRLTQVEARLMHVEARLDAMDRRFDGIDQRLDGIDKRLDGMDRRFDALEQRFDLFQAHTDEAFRSMRNEFEARIDSVRIDIKRLDNLAELRERLASVEAKLAQHN
jgi:chromosome segregation ATPase